MANDSDELSILSSVSTLTTIHIDHYSHAVDNEDYVRLAIQLGTASYRVCFCAPLCTVYGKVADIVNDGNYNSNGRIKPTSLVGTLQPQGCPLVKTNVSVHKTKKDSAKKTLSQIKLGAIWNSSSAVYKSQCTQKLFLLIIYNFCFKKVKNPKHSMIKQLYWPKYLRSLDEAIINIFCFLMQTLVWLTLISAVSYFDLCSILLVSFHYKCLSVM